MLARLRAADIPQLEMLERETGLSFWGNETYRKIVEELPEYYGCALLVCQPHGGGAMAGFLLARFACDALEILKVAVLPGYQRRGFGSRLLAEAVSEGRKRGCLNCYLEVRASNQAAIRFYAERAFARVGTRPRYYSDPLEDALIMHRDLF